MQITQVLPLGSMATQVPSNVPLPEVDLAFGVLRRMRGDDATNRFGATVAGNGAAFDGAITGAVALDLNVRTMKDSIFPVAGAAGVEIATTGTESAKLGAFMTKLDSSREMLGKLKSNLDPSDFDDPDAFDKLLGSLKANEFVAGALVDGKELLYRSSYDKAPAGLVDLVKASRELGRSL